MQRGEQVGGEALHREEPLLEGSGLGGLVCILGCEEEEKAFWGGGDVGVV